MRSIILHNVSQNIFSFRDARWRTISTQQQIRHSSHPSPHSSISPSQAGGLAPHGGLRRTPVTVRHVSIRRIRIRKFGTFVFWRRPRSHRRIAISRIGQRRRIFKYANIQFRLRLHVTVDEERGDVDQVCQRQEDHDKEVRKT